MAGVEKSLHGTCVLQRVRRWGVVNRCNESRVFKFLMVFPYTKKSRHQLQSGLVGKDRVDGQRDHP
jgi:hypothetical protein